MSKRKQLITYDEAVPTKSQHRKPCSDCPWARKSLKGWLADIPPENWIQDAHGEAFIECHTKTDMEGTPHQCAGLAIYRANVCKKPRSPEVIRLPADRERVFATPLEFLAHHGATPPSLEDDEDGY